MTDQDALRAKAEKLEHHARTLAEIPMDAYEGECCHRCDFREGFVSGYFTRAAEPVTVSEDEALAMEAAVEMENGNLFNSHLLVRYMLSEAGIRIEGDE